MSSTRCWMCSGGGGVTLDTAKATAKFTSAPMGPKASGEMPKSQFSTTSFAISVPGTKNQPLNQKMYSRVTLMPDNDA